MATRFTLPLTDPHATLDTVGGKGASLARMGSAGLPVPDGFHVVTAAYKKMVVENKLQPRILAILETVDVSKPTALSEASKIIEELFNRAVMPVDISGAIQKAYASLPGENPSVAVRSSATAEDLPEASFAGQQETFLNVRGIEALLESIMKCWASLWTARAIGYRSRRNISPDEVALAVVVQLMAPAEAAGILFTADPVSGARDRVIINAAWGLGEAVVGGLVSPDALTLDKASGSVIHRQTADKQVMTVKTEHGTEQQPVPDSLRRSPVLSDEQAGKLARYGDQIEKLFGVPMDVEWALADRKFAILQARPITALPESEGPFAKASPVEVEWILPDPKGQYMRSSVIDILPDPVSPLFETLGIPTLVERVNFLAREVTHIEPNLPEDYYTTMNHYAYLNTKIPPKCWRWIITGLLPAMPRLLSKGHLILKNQMRPRYTDSIALWQAKPLEQMPIDELWNGITQVLQAAMTYLGTMLFTTTGSSAGSEMLFNGIYNKFVRKQDDPPAVVFLMGYDSVPIQAEKSLFDLAIWCRGRENISTYILSQPSGKVVAQLETGLPPQGVEHEEWQAFREKFRTHLMNYGHIIFNLDFAYPLPIDHPEPMLETCKMYLRGEGVNPHERQHASEGKREQAVRAILARVRGIRRWIFQKSLGWAQSLSEIRETALADIGLGYPLLRKMFNELGKHLAQEGVIDNADDIYWMEKAEIEAAMQALKSGETLTNLSKQVRGRKLDREYLKSVTPPPILPPKEKIMGIKTDLYIAVTESDQTINKLKGVAASGGKVTAPACVLSEPQDFEKMKPGEVLVAGTTTPAWTPLFAMASAVVTDIGGPLSHGSIVAREYGIPAVMGTGVATRWIRNGQVITVDGDAGLVIVNAEI